MDATSVLCIKSENNDKNVLLPQSVDNILIRHTLFVLHNRAPRAVLRYDDNLGYTRERRRLQLLRELQVTVPNLSIKPTSDTYQDNTIAIKLVSAISKRKFEENKEDIVGV